MDHIELDCEVLLNEFVRILPVCEDSADSSCGKNHKIWAFRMEELSRLVLIGEIKFIAAADKHVFVSSSAESAQNGPSY